MVQRVLSNVARTAQKEDKFAKLVGHIGLWQLLFIAPVAVVKLSSGWIQMAIVFLTPQLTFWCVNFEGNSSHVVVNNTCYRDCVKYQYDTSPFDNTIVSEWDLVCERAWLASFTQTILQLGILIGSIIFGFLSDRFGRKMTFLLSVTLLIAFGFGVPFSPNYAVFTSLRFFLGVATAGTMVVSFVIIMEAVGSKYRELVGCYFQIPFVLGHVTVPLFAYYNRSWNTYCLALAAPAVVYLGYFFLVTESPRWLISVGKVEQAEKIVTKAARMNRLPTAIIHDTLIKLSQEIKSKSEEPKMNYSDLLRPSLRKITAGSCVMWLVAGFTFFGFNQYIGQTSPDPFVSVAIAGAIQIPANLLATWLMRRFGRRSTVAACFCLSGLCVVTLGCLPDIYWVTLTLGTLGVSFASIVAASVYIFSTELYPTVVRNMGMGISSMAMRAGSMVAPFVANTASTITWLPTVIFGLTPILAGLVVLLLPETNGRSLPDNIDEVSEKAEIQQ